MKPLHNHQEIGKQFAKNCVRLSFLPLIITIPTFVLGVELESSYDFLLEVCRLYLLLCMATVASKVINSKPIQLGFSIAVINAFYDAMTELVVIEQWIADPMPFADALFDEFLLIVAYALITYGLLQHLKRINKLAIIDSLTQCYTKQAVDFLPEAKYQVYYFNLDNFSSINEQYGHLHGDKTLVAFANILLATCNELGYVARVGGDEFVAFVNHEKAEDVIEEITSQAGSQAIEFSYGTASLIDKEVGVAVEEANKNLKEMKIERDLLLARI